MAALSQVIATHVAGAEICSGEATCRQKFNKIMEEFSFPKGLLPLDQAEELGFNKSSGFFWLKRKNKKVHKFKQAGSTVTYDPTITAFIEERKIRKLTGVKSKEMMLNLTISDMYIKDPTSGKITFGIPSGLTRDNPISHYVIEADEDVKP